MPRVETPPLWPTEEQRAKEAPSVFDTTGDKVWRLARMLAGDPTDQAMGLANPVGVAAVTPLQVVRALRASGDVSMPLAKKGQTTVGEIFPIRHWLKKQWEHVGGPGKTDVETLGAGAEASVLEARPHAAGASELLKIYPHTPPRVSKKLLDPEKLSQPYMAPTRGAAHPTAPFAYAVQPKGMEVGYAIEAMPRQQAFEKMTELLTAIRDSPFAAQDITPWNVGKFGDEFKVFDLGAVGKRKGRDLREYPQPQDVYEALGWRRGQ